MIVYPSSLFETSDDSSSDFYEKSFKNPHLRLGIILGVYETDSDENINKTVPEYDVMAIEQEADYGINTTIYKNCVTFDGFGGIADYFQMKLRPVKDPKKTKSTGSFKDETGSIVLLMCLDGISEKAIIIKCFSNPSKPVLTKDKGHHLEGEFNGINYSINNDGELTVTFRSATNDDGTVKDEKASGSYLKFEKDGSFQVNDNNKESIRIDKTNKTIMLKAEKDISNVTEANYNITSKESTNIKADKDILGSAQGKITFDAQAPSVFKSAAIVTIEAPTVKIQGTDMIMAQANTIQLLGNKVIAGSGATPAVTMTTQTITYIFGIPFPGTMIGPYSSSVMVGA
jgi:phage baseplate assembly protein gpV